ncbi:hypothetical protein VY88_01450 [Azospirillum thiophilum]|uniref:Uncharacterized protein n=1 Tax=Azospirillum thiophilum TaxID=528244 RepID=A0AAC8VY73_9PROT|nr:hypothetical protein [Azospirillum thiophilum]ALG71391.1 hypothetical protein AL072_11260 [Azospirillum thiophilum]KJR64958.1 hypothetical protein VY88_01450 [Azospirillum thiophilum]
MTGRKNTERATGEASLKARRELAALNDALTLAERGLGRQSPAALMARLLRVAAMHPKSVDDTLMWQVTDLVAGGEVGEGVKLTLIRMGWASIVQAQYKQQGLRLVVERTAERVAA